ncbi:hypothetical protein EGW08_014624 [Elysia chlorotica]|uniref:Uncharacterized protein n=1 Tax=Elysia chlorotica TaxID=188477 RepID=A0A433T832_ELYCH|nr:hypothetical protein EGW08_014624 [Elysia chlorotica]
MIEPALSTRCARPVCPTQTFNADCISCSCLHVLHQSCPACVAKSKECVEGNPCLGRFCNDMRKSLSADSGCSLGVQDGPCSLESPGPQSPESSSNEDDMQRNMYIAARKLSWKVRLPDLSALSDKLSPSLSHMAVENHREYSPDNQRTHLWDDSSDLIHPNQKNKETVLSQSRGNSNLVTCDGRLLSDSQDVAFTDGPIHSNGYNHCETSETTGKARSVLTFTPSVNLMFAELPTSVQQLAGLDCRQKNSCATCCTSFTVALSSPSDELGQNIVSTKAKTGGDGRPNACVESAGHGPGADQLDRRSLQSEPNSGRVVLVNVEPGHVGMAGGGQGADRLRGEPGSGGSMGDRDLWRMADAQEYTSLATGTRLDTSLDMGISLASLDCGEDLDYTGQKRGLDPPGSGEERTLINTDKMHESAHSFESDDSLASRTNPFHSADEHSLFSPKNSFSVTYHKPLKFSNSAHEDCHLDLASYSGTGPPSSVNEFGSCATHVDFSNSSSSEYITALGKSETSLGTCADFDAFSRVLTRRRLMSSTPNKLTSDHRQRQRSSSDSCLACGSGEEDIPLRKIAAFRSWPGPLLALTEESHRENSRTRRDSRRRGQIFECDFSSDGQSLDSVLSPPSKSYDCTDSPFNRFSRSSRGFRARRKGMCNPVGAHLRKATTDLSPLLQGATSYTVRYNKHQDTQEISAVASESFEKLREVSGNSSSSSESDSSPTAATLKPKRPSHLSCLRSVGSALRRLSSPSKNLSVASLLGSRKCTYDLELASQAYFRLCAPSPSSFKKRKKSSYSPAPFVPLPSQPSSLPSSPCCSAAQSPWQYQRVNDTTCGPGKFSRCDTASLSSSASSLPLICSRGRSVSVDNCTDVDRRGATHAWHRTRPKEYGACRGSVTLPEAELDNEAVRLRKISYEHASYIRCGDSMLLLDAL